jgi:farnesyl diphosphate synthase
MQDFESRLTALGDRMNAALDALLPRPQGPEAQVIEAMRYAVFAGGKRLRPFLTLEAGRLFDADENALIRTAVAIECLHTYSLVHDDLPAMDDDDLRRGRPTVHKQWDEATAILAGDGLLTLAFEILSDPATHPDPQMRCLLIGGLARAAGAQGMVGGQMIDMLSEAATGDDTPDIAAITRMNRLKTGALISFSVDAGALIGCAPDDARQALARYANDLGLAFQMADDLLDVQGSPEATGKAVAKDSARGKVNFVTLMGEEGAARQVRLLAAQAARHLAIFGPRAKLLNAAVDFVVGRRY